jgi:hypothetical protein
MTTVAYRSGVMACDSCWTHYESVDTLTTKIRRLSSGAIIGQAGDNDARFFDKLLDKVKSPAGLPTYAELAQVRQNFTGLLVFPSGRIFKLSTTFISPENWDENLDDEIGVWEVSTPFAAIGSGKELAVGAMAAGKAAKDAVAIACRYDIHSRLPVHSVFLKPPPKKRR